MSEMPAKRKRGRPKTVDRDHTTQVAMMSYWRDGVRQVSIRDICERAGVTKPSLYREFGSEDGLRAAVLERYRVEVIASVFNMLGADRPFTVVRDEFLHWIAEPKQGPTGCLLVMMQSCPQGFGEATTRLITELGDQFRDVYQAWFERGVQQGELDAGIPAELGGAYITSQMGMFLMKVAAGEDRALALAQVQLAFSALDVRAA